jgi:hypothetical protein
MTDLHFKFIENYFKLFYELYKKKDFEIFNKDFLTISLLKENIGYFGKHTYLVYNTNKIKSKIIEEESLKGNIDKDLINKYNSVIDQKYKELKNK